MTLNTQNVSDLKGLQVKTKIVLALSASLFLGNFLYADVDTNATAPVLVNCVTTQELLTQPIGDDNGNQVLTSKKIYQHCTETYQKRGACEEWEYTHSETAMPYADGVGIEEYQDTGNMAQALSTIAAINQTTAIFSGVKGYCEVGMTEDTSWLEDPMFWASIALSAISAAGEPTEAMEKAAKKAAETSTTAASKAAAEAAADAAVDAAVASGDAAAQATAEAAADAAWEASTEAAFAAEDAAANATSEIAKMTDIQKFANIINNGYSGCAVSAGLDMFSAALDYVKDDEDCDPIDEFCDADSEGQIDMNDPTMVQTLTLDEYNKILLDNPEVVNAIEVIDDGADSGFVTIRLLGYGETIDFEALANDEAALQQAKQDAKDLQFATKGVLAAASMASCMGGQALFNNNPLGGETGGNGAMDGGSTSNTDEALGSTGSMALGAAVGMLPFPYNVIGSVVLKLLDTWTPIDTCHDEEDAIAEGGRHEKAYRGIIYNTCHPIANSRVVEEWPWGGTMRTGFDYCCYDSPLSKILMVQLKSSVGKGWTHCTDITLNELSHASFRACTEEEMNPATNGGFEDGASFRGVEGVDYVMTQSYQYQFQCMNLTELEEYVESQVPVDFSQTHVSEIINDLSNSDMR